MQQNALNRPRMNRKSLILSEFVDEAHRSKNNWFQDTQARSLSAAFPVLVGPQICRVLWTVVRCMFASTTIPGGQWNFCGNRVPRT
jgi:hypothetical protein